MLVLIAILLSTSQVLAKFTSRFKDPIFPQYPDNMEGIPFRLGSMTPYHPPDKTCSPIKAHCTMRHGAKFPKEAVQHEIAELELIKQYFIERYTKDENALNALPATSKEVIRKIMNWQNKTSDASAKEINDQGLLTMHRLGNRWNSRLLNIVTNIESEEDIEFNSAKEDRCKKSGEEFLKGFLKIKKESTVEKIPPFNLPQGDDHRIKLDKGKPEVKSPQAKKPEEEEEVEIIYYNKVCPEKTCYLIEKIINLLFPRGYGPEEEWEKWRAEITSAKAKAMYMACANSYVYEYSDQEEGHAWCYLFDNNDIIMFEGMHDYQYYIKNGYNDIKTMNYGHPMMKDIVQFLEKEEPKKFKLFASHTSNCLSLITGFRMFQDKEKITLENMTKGDKMSNKKWKSSLIGNYACNIMVVVYECENANYKISEEVSIFLNETPLEMVLENEITCTQCPIDAVKKLINELLDDIPTDEELNEYENLQKGKMLQEKIDDSNISESSVKA